MSTESTVSNLTKQLGQGDLGNITTYQAGVLQSHAHRVLHKHCDEVLKPYGITKTQWLVLGTVLDSGDDGIRLTDLAEKIGTTLAYLTTTLNLLENKGFVERKSHTSDSRAKFILIKSDKIDKCHEIERYLRDALRKSIYAEVSSEDFRTYMKVLNQLSKVS